MLSLIVLEHQSALSACLRQLSTWAAVTELWDTAAWGSRGGGQHLGSGGPRGALAEPHFWAGNVPNPPKVTLLTPSPPARLVFCMAADLCLPVHLSRGPWPLVAPQGPQPQRAWKGTFLSKLILPISVTFKQPSLGPESPHSILCYILFLVCSASP